MKGPATLLGTAGCGDDNECNATVVDESGELIAREGGSSFTA